MTGEWSYGVGGGLVSPVAVVNPSPIVGYPAAAVFSPSPIFAPPPPPPVNTKGKNEKKEGQKEGEKEGKKEGRGWWETKYDDDGVRFWENTVTKKTTYKDPYY